uniref:PHD-finger domain-containing protein n=1 Tax=Toxoplasma gondii COUG TaxID=1074873 RepID=A0A2G8Y504_TOXGO|nr:PHD-finger domain-containing protein [Toxoplasma gondii COUG]
MAGPRQSLSSSKPAAKKRMTKSYVMTEVFPEVVQLSRLQLDQACAVCLGEFQEDNCAEEDETSPGTTAAKPSTHVIDISESPAVSVDPSPPAASSSSPPYVRRRRLSRMKPSALSSRDSPASSRQSLLPLGLISCCSHVFHHVCIEKWCTRENSCPQCKCRFSWLASYSRTGEREAVTRVRKLDQAAAYTEHDTMAASHFLGTLHRDWMCPACGQTVRQDDRDFLVCEEQSCGERYHRACCLLSPEHADISLPWICVDCRESGRPCIDCEGRRMPRQYITEDGFFLAHRRRQPRRQGRQGGSVASRRDRRSRSAARRSRVLRDHGDSEFLDDLEATNTLAREEPQSSQARRDENPADSSAAAAPNSPCQEPQSETNSRDASVVTAEELRGAGQEQDVSRSNRKTYCEGELVRGSQRAQTSDTNVTSVHWLEDILNWGDAVVGGQKRGSSCSFPSSFSSSSSFSLPLPSSSSSSSASSPFSSSASSASSSSSSVSPLPSSSSFSHDSGGTASSSSSASASCPSAAQGESFEPRRSFMLEQHLTRLAALASEYSVSQLSRGNSQNTASKPAASTATSPNEANDDEAVGSESVSDKNGETGPVEEGSGLPRRLEPRRRIPINTEMLSSGAFRPRRQLEFPGPSSVLLARRKQFDSKTERRRGVARNSFFSTTRDTSAGSISFDPRRPSNSTHVSESIQSGAVIEKMVQPESRTPANSGQVSAARLCFMDTVFGLSGGACGISRSPPLSAAPGVHIAGPGVCPSSSSASCSGSSPISSSTATRSFVSIYVRNAHASRVPPPCVGITEVGCKSAAAAVRRDDAFASARQTGPNYFEGVLIRKQKRHAADVACWNSGKGQALASATEEDKDSDFSHASRLSANREEHSVQDSRPRRHVDTDACVYNSVAAGVDCPGVIRWERLPAKLSKPVLLSEGEAAPAAATCGRGERQRKRAREDREALEDSASGHEHFGGIPAQRGRKTIRPSSELINIVRHILKPQLQALSWSCYEAFRLEFKARCRKICHELTDKFASSMPAGGTHAARNYWKEREHIIRDVVSKTFARCAVGDSRASSREVV